MQQTNLTAIIFLLFFRWRSPLSFSLPHFYLYVGVYLLFLYFIIFLWLFGGIQLLLYENLYTYIYIYKCMEFN